MAKQTETWDVILKSFNEQIAAANTSSIAARIYKRDQVQSRWTSLKTDYTAFRSLKETSGLGWDNMLQIPIAEESVWKEYTESHKDAKKFRRETLPCFEDLDELLRPSIATGSYARSSQSQAVVNTTNSAAVNTTTSAAVNTTTSVTVNTTSHTSTSSSNTIVFFYNLLRLITTQETS